MGTRYVSERLVGRERELSRLAIALDGASDGRSPRVLIGGPGGVGVSRLVDETVRRVARLDEPFRVVRCTAYAGLRHAANAPVARVNDNRRPAGTLTGKTLTLALDIVEAGYQPEG